jgi:hypothetical protein
VETVIGHQEIEGHLDRNFLRGEFDDKANSLLTRGLLHPTEPSASKEQPILSVKSFCEVYSDFKEGGMRHYIFNEKSNGLAKSGGIVRLGSKVLINVEKFFERANSYGKK